MYHGRMPVLTRRNATRSMTVGERFTEVHSRDYVPCVAMLWPVKHAQDLLDWWARQPRTRPDRADDGIIGRWRRARRHTIHATVPSLFEHPDDVPSTIKLRNYERRALFFAEDASRYDWS
jgi:hypothetical protein